MRSRYVLLSALVLLGGCGLFKRRSALSEAESAHQSPRNASVLGEWVLATPPDSTVFAGARQVDLNLTEQSFTFTVHYPQRTPVVITGTASTDPGGGPLILVPTTITRGSGDITGVTPALVTGQSYTVIATAAENTMVFAPPRPEVVVPSSVWYRRSSAQAAGIIKRDSTKRTP
jgi:hypothetical protein